MFVACLRGAVLIFVRCCLPNVHATQGVVCVIVEFLNDIPSAKPLDMAVNRRVLMWPMQ